MTAEPVRERYAVAVLAVRVEVGDGLDLRVLPAETAGGGQPRRPGRGRSVDSELAYDHRLLRVGGPGEERRRGLGERLRRRERVDVLAHPADLGVARVERLSATDLEAVSGRAPDPADVVGPGLAEDRRDVVPRLDVS